MNFSLLPGLQTKRNAIRLGSLAVKLMLFLPLPALCQGRPIATVSVPFSFSANGQVLPAGDYMLLQENGNILTLRTRTGVVTRRVVVFADSSFRIPEAGKVVFRSYDDGYHLDSVWTAGSQSCIRLPRSKQEKAEIAARTRLANTTLVASTREVTLDK